MTRFYVNGYNNSCGKAISHRGLLITVQLKTFHQVTWWDTLSVIFLQELGDGLMHLNSPVGLATDMCGRLVALANLSARQAKEKGLMMSGTYGLLSSTSSASENLTRCLGNKLQKNMASRGLMVFRVTWKQSTTPSGQRLQVQQVAVLPTSDSGYTSWPTPSARDFRSDSSKKTDEEIYSNGGKSGKPLPRIIRKHLGLTPYGNKARMAYGDQPNPEFVCWLMGYKTAWVRLGALVMR